MIDFGDLPLFSVAAYPSVVIGHKVAKVNQDGPVRVADLVYPVRRKLAADGNPVNTDTVRQALGSLPAMLREAEVPGYPQSFLRRSGWILEEPRLVRLFDRLMATGTPLGKFVKGRMYRGVLTGLNEAFVIDAAKRDELIAADPRSAEVIKPWLRGRDIRRWKAEWAGLYIIAIQNSDDADATNPWARARTESEARRIFRETYSAIEAHLAPWEQYPDPERPGKTLGLRPRADQGRWWWELRACAYYREFQTPKVIWPRNIPPWECRFAVDDNAILLNDKAYMLAGASPQLCTYLNSSITLWIVDKLTTKLRGGWIELKSDEVASKIPIPRRLPNVGIGDDQSLHHAISSSLGLSADTLLG